MVVATSYRTLGIVGMCVNGVFLCICLWRTVGTLQAMTELSENRVRLHLTLLVFSVFEFLYQVGIFVTNDIPVWGYIFHILALSTYIISFCLIFMRWERTLGFARSNAIKVGRVAFGIAAINIVFNTMFIVLVCVDKEYIYDSGQLWFLKISRDLVECFSLLFSTIWLFAYSIHLSDRLSRVLSNTAATTSSSTNSLVAKMQKQRSVRRIVIVLFFCSLCYVLRFAGLMLQVIDALTGTSRVERFEEIGWFLLSNWIPTLVPGLLFLYTSRMIKVDEIKKTNALQDMFKEDFTSEYSFDGDEIATNPVHSTDMPSVNIDGIDRPSADFQAEIRNRASADSQLPGHSFYDDTVSLENEDEEEGDISLSRVSGAVRPSTVLHPELL